jgi:MoaA/NifB/PqqE/SkfB family radical SAM enzyme
VANGEKAAVLWKIHDNFAASVDNPARLAITSGGDCFASQIYLKFLQNFDETKFRDTKITLRTNGLLFKKYWNSIKKVHKRIDEVMISIDAACRETYEKVRRGGNWERLLENLEFIKEVNGRDANFSYMMPFCVQKANFREMGDYVDFAEKYGATCVLFMFLLPNGDLTGEAYDDAAVFKPAHPLYTEYRGLLIDPRLYRPIVSLPNEMRV